MGETQACREEDVLQALPAFQRKPLPQSLGVHQLVFGRMEHGFNFQLIQPFVVLLASEHGDLGLEVGLLRPVGGIIDGSLEQFVQKGLLLGLDLADVFFGVALGGQHIGLMQLPDLGHVPAELGH